MYRRRGRRTLLALLISAILAACAGAAPAIVSSPTPVHPTARPSVTATVTLPATATSTETIAPSPDAPLFWFSGPDVTFQDVHFTLPTGLATEVHALVAPATEAFGESYPAYTQFTLVNYDSRNTRFEPQIQIYPVSELGQTGTQVAQALKEILTEKPASFQTGIGIPVLSVRGAGQLMDAQVRYLSFANGSGVRVLTQFAQNWWPINNGDLVYVFQGLTSDNAYYISAILPVTAPFLPEQVDDPAAVPPVDGVSFPASSSPNFGEEYSSYQRAVIKKLNEISPEEFVPSLSMLDALMESLQVESDVVTDSSAPSSSPCLNAPPTHLRVGQFAYVNPDPPLPNNLRKDAGVDQDFIGEIPPGKAMKILDGPKCADGWVWWKVRALETEVVGWTPEGDKQDYWLIPCTSQKGCRP